MNKKNVAKRVGELRIAHQRALNDLYIWSSFARAALESAKADEQFLNQKRFKVPSKTKNKEVDRSADDLKQIASRAVDREIFYAVFVYAVAQVEAFLNDVLTLLLQSDRRRLKTRIHGINHTKSIDVDELIDAATHDQLIDRLIKKELGQVFYAAPKSQLEYYEKVTGAKLDETLAKQWFEAKATRDIIVHNSGIANDTYLKKAGDLQRAEDGEQIPVDAQYFADTLKIMKSLIGKISSKIQNDLRGATKESKASE